MGEIKIIKCPHCNREIRRQRNIEGFICFGSPIKSCRFCNKTYYDSDYHEFALDMEPPESSKQKTEARKRSLFREDQKERELTPYEESEKRLENYDYLVELYKYGYNNLNHRAQQRLKERVRKVLSEQYISVLQDKLGSPGNIYRIKCPEKLFGRLTFEAKDANAVKTIVKEVLNHYGIDDSKYQIVVEYQENSIPEQGGTLGTFTQWEPYGGLIKIIMTPNYSEYDMVIAVILHECAHALLYSRMINLPNQKDNERLTDVTAIYMGGANYIKRGCYRFRSSHIGYLEEIECDVVMDEIAKKRDEQYDKIRLVKTEIIGIIPKIEKNMKDINETIRTIHPSRVIRNTSFVIQTQDFFINWNKEFDDVSREMEHIKENNYTDEQMAKKALERLHKINNDIDSHKVLLDEWRQAELYQSSLSYNKITYVKTKLEKAEEGNVYAMLDMVTFWMECAATKRDAVAYYDQFIKRNDDPDSLYAAGYCCLQGLATEKDIDLGRSLLCKAASLGSQEAVKLL